jgi:hypothetical protein
MRTHVIIITVCAINSSEAVRIDRPAVIICSHLSYLHLSWQIFLLNTAQL